MDNPKKDPGAEQVLMVLNITRMTIHNGPGIRTLVLFKGCPLRCRWCSTPESQMYEPQLGFDPKKCIKCWKCLVACPVNAIKVQDESIKIDRKICHDCGQCTAVCNACALWMCGERMSVQALAEEVKKDSLFYKNSGGGVTLSGGEPLFNVDAIITFLRALKGENINIGVDTSGYVSRDKLEQVLPWVDFFLWDIKHMDSKRHQDLTGVDNSLVLKNLKFVSGKGIPIYLRYPIIPGMTDSEGNLRSVCEMAKGLKSLVEVDLLPIHHLGKARYANIGQPYPLKDVNLIPDEIIEEMKRVVESYRLKCLIGG